MTTTMNDEDVAAAADRWIDHYWHRQQLARLGGFGSEMRSDPGPLIAATTRLRRLSEWKDEAIVLLDILDQCHDLLPRYAQAQSGESKAEAVKRYLEVKDRALALLLADIAKRVTP